MYLLPVLNDKKILLRVARFAQARLLDYMHCHVTASCFWHKREHFGGTCAIASVFLARLFEVAIGQSVEVVSGDFGGDEGDGVARPHYWVQIPTTGTVIDITVNQFCRFGYEVPSILVGSDHPALKYYCVKRVVRQRNQFGFLNSAIHPYGIVSNERKNHQKWLFETSGAHRACSRVFGRDGANKLRALHGL